MKKLLLLTLIAIICIWSGSVESASVEKYIRDYFAAHITDTGKDTVTLGKGEQWATGANQVKIRKIPIPETREKAYKIPISYSDGTTDFAVNILLYVNDGDDNIDGGKPYNQHQREWTLEIPKKGTRKYDTLAPSKVVIYENYAKHLNYQYIKPTVGKIDWIHNDPDIDITPIPADSVDFLGCFWFQLFQEFDIASATTTDAAKIDNDDYKPLRFIRAFAGKPSTYHHEKKIAGITFSTFDPQPPSTVIDPKNPSKQLNYKELIKELKEYKMSELKDELEKAGRVNQWDAIVNIAKNTQWDKDGKFQEIKDKKTDTFMDKKDKLGPFMEFLWFGEKGSAAGKTGPETNIPYWKEIFSMFYEPRIRSQLVLRRGGGISAKSETAGVRLSQLLQELNKRYQDMKFTQPSRIRRGWKGVCAEKKFKVAKLDEKKTAHIIGINEETSLTEMSDDAMPILAKLEKGPPPPVDKTQIDDIIKEKEHSGTKSDEFNDENIKTLKLDENAEDDLTDSFQEQAYKFEPFLSRMEYENIAKQQFYNPRTERGERHRQSSFITDSQYQSYPTPSGYNGYAQNIMILVFSFAMIVFIGICCSLCWIANAILAAIGFHLFHQHKHFCNEHHLCEIVQIKE